MADDRAVGEPERLHPLFLLTGIGGALRGMAGGYAVIAYLAVSGRLSTALFGVVALLAVTAVSLILYWRRFEYRVGDSEIRIDSGIFSRTHRSIPFDRVQDVDITQGPVARLVGLATVKFETGASAGKEEGVLQAVSLDRAEALREMVRARRSGAGAAEAVADEAERPPVYAMDPPRLLLAGLFNFSLAVFAGLFGLTQTFGDVIGFDPLNRAFWMSMLSADNPIAQFLLAHQVATAIIGLLSLVLIGIGTGIVRTVLRDYRFRLDRTETGLRRRRGLLTLTDVTLPLRRAQAAIVGTGPVRDRFGWRELKLQSLARDEGGSGDHVLAPLASDEETGTILEALGWRPLARKIGWQRVSGAYVRGLAIALLPPMLLAVAIVVLAPIAAPPGAGAVDGSLSEAVWGAQLAALILFGVMVFGLAARWLAWHRTGFVLDEDRLLIRTGWWRRQTLILPVRRIQSIDLISNFISRWFGVASLTFGVAGGSGFSAHQIPALNEEKARDLREQLLSRLV